MANLKEVLSRINARPGASDQELASAERILSGLQQQRFSGIAEITYKDGRIMLLRTNDTVRPAYAEQSVQQGRSSER